MSQHTQVNLENINVTNTIISFLFVGLICSINAVAIERYRVELFDYGIYETVFMKYDNAPNTSEGKIERISHKKLLRRTEQIPGKKGTKFGIRYILGGAQQGKDVEVLVKVMHSVTVDDQVISKANEWLTTKRIGRVSFDGWKFNTDSELIHGDWTIQIYHEGTKLVEKSFHIFKT